MPTRRQFITRGGAAAAVAILAPQDALAAKRRQRAALLPGGRFSQGVLSGDPATDAITLSTIVDHVGGSGRVRLEVAADAGFDKVIARQDILTTTAVGHAVKARVTGLKPHRRYWYRFETRDRHSPVGRFQTALPEGSRETVRFGFFSCADYADGYYNAYELLAREDLDFVVCLGDYIYAETYAYPGDGRGVRQDGIGRENPHYGYVEAATLDEYRRKYALYRSDASLRRVHQTFPLVGIWDDHEVQNNYAGGDDDGGVTLRADYSRARRQASYQAFFEAMPTFPRGGNRIYRAMRHGVSVDLLLLDERQYRGDQPCSDAIADPCASWDRPRSLLGRRQLDYVKRRLSGSRAAWKVIAGQGLMMPLRVHDGQYFRFDSWQGYPQEREGLLAHIGDRGIKDVVFLTGDTHCFIAGDVARAMGTGAVVASEFTSGSISSASVGEQRYRMPAGAEIPGNPANPSAPPDVIAHYKALNPWWAQVDLDRHGYGIVAASPTVFDVTQKRLWTVKQRNLGTLPSDGFQWRLARGQTSIKARQ
jgi:alkaline phosphatase D